MSIGKLIAYTLRRFFDLGHEQRIPCPYFQSYETTDLTIKTRMHSSRMRTVRSSERISRGVSAPWGVSALGGVCPGGCLLGGGIPACTEADTPTLAPVDRQTPVKT